MNRDELSSTEKLLEQIRGPRPPGDPPPAADEPAAVLPSAWRTGIPSAMRIKKSACVGVDIGYVDVRLIKTFTPSGDRRQMIDTRRVPYDAGLEPHSLLFPQFLRNVLDRFAGPHERARLWATTSSARLDVRLLHIPKVTRRQIPNAVLWAYKKKTPFNDKERLFDFEILREISDGDSPQIEVLAYTIPREDIDVVKTSFMRAGYPLEGISTYPFLLQNLLRTRWKILAQGYLCALYIGRNWSRIDIFRDGDLLQSRGIRAGLNSMIDALKADPRMDADTDAQAPPGMEFGLSSPAQGAQDAATPNPYSILACLVPGAAPRLVNEAATPEGCREFEPDGVFEAIQPALDRLIRQVERTISHFAISFEDCEIDRLCLSGLICESEQVRTYIADQLGTPLVDLNPFENESLADTPESPSEQRAYIPALGLASPPESQSPNFLHTYHDRARRETRQRFNCIVFVLFLATMLGFLGYNGWQKHRLQARHRHMAMLESQLTASTPLLNPETVLVLAAKAKEATERLNRYSERYTGMAVIAELSRRTPDDIDMTRMAIRLPPKAAAADESGRRVLSITGIVSGDRLNLEPSLAAYMVRMKSSPLLAEPKIIEKTFEMLDGREVLRFTAELEIL